MEKNRKFEEKVPEIIKRLLAIVIVIIVISAGYFWFINSTKSEETEDAYVETHTVTVAPKVSGQVIKMLVTDNQKVREGELVAEIDPVDYEAKLAEISAKYESTLLRQKNAKANYNATESQIQLANRNLGRYTELYKKGAVSKLEYDNAKTTYDKATAELTNARENLLSNGKNSVADADLRQLAALKKQAALALSYTKIYAPQSGSVSSKAIEKGAIVAAGQPLFTIVPDNIWVIANFKETQLRYMKVGQDVGIKLDTYPDKEFKGKVESIQNISGAKSSIFPPENSVGSFVKIVQRIPVKIVFTEKVDPKEYNIVAGMSAVPEVRVKQ